MQGLTEWAQDLLISRGALLEADEGALRALLPADVAVALRCGEWLSLNFEAGAGADDSGEWIDRLGALLPANCPLIAARLRQRAAVIGFDAAGALLSERFGGVPDPGLVAACVDATGGNPFLLGELVNALVADRVAPDADAAGLVAELGPETVARSVMLRLARLPAAAGPVAEAVAVLDAQAEARHVAAVCGLSLEEIGSAADALAEANVLDRRRPLRFVHPIVRQAVYGALGSGLRSRLHARAAKVLIADQAEPERVAAHLLLCEPAADPRAVQVLRAAAAAALSRGSAVLAQRFLERALVEPPPVAEAADTMGELGAAEASAGRELSRASERLERAG